LNYKSDNNNEFAIIDKIYSIALI